MPTEDEAKKRELCMKLKEYNLLMDEDAADKDWINRWLAFSEKHSEDYMKIVNQVWYLADTYDLGDAELAKKTAELLHLVDSININESDREKLRKVIYEIAEQSKPSLEFLTEKLCYEYY